MQPLGTVDLYLTIFAAVVLPLILVANLTGGVRSSPASAYLWRDHPTFMWLSMVILGVLSLFSLVQLAGHYGIVSGAVAETAMTVIGIPFLVLAIAEIWLGGRIAVQYLRNRRAAG